MEMSITGAEASAIIAVKYPDLSEGLPLPEAILCTPPPPARLRRKRPHTPHSRRRKLGEHFNQMVDRSVTLLYPPLYARDDHQEEDAFIPYVSPLKAERMSSYLRVRALSTPPKKSKRGSRSIVDSAKKLRARQSYYVNNVGLKHKILRLCGASKSPHASKYMSIPR